MQSIDDYLPAFFLRVFFSGELSFQEYEKRVREVNTDYSNVTVGKVLDTREAEIVDIDKLIDELSDIDDISGLSSSETSDESSSEKKTTKKKKITTADAEPKSKRRRRSKKHQQREFDDDSDEEDEEEEEEEEEKIIDPNEIRNRMVQHLEQMRLAKQKMKRSESRLSLVFSSESMICSRTVR